MDFTGDYFAAAEPAKTGLDAQVRVYRGAAGLTAVQLGGALDNPELLEGNWQLVHTIPAAPGDTGDIAGALDADASISCAQAGSFDVGRGRILQLEDARLEAGRRTEYPPPFRPPRRHHSRCRFRCHGFAAVQQVQLCHDNLAACARPDDAVRG
ncbi:hypothetical protein HER39_03470 [Arthrobacter deserti]|uniref:Uncharacterized protein n=1 Tax=Arthrobacter deserti TaxID=1742687 RepID=A0ABX1JKF9_9MICC|nr:hypothetical protein [Arthrobacter deserti]